MRRLTRDDAPERMSLPDFLAWEAAQPLRHERVGGSVWAMTGGTLAHNRIGLNVFSALRTRLAGSGCEAFALCLTCSRRQDPDEVQLPQIAPDGEGGIVMHWEQRGGRHVLGGVEGWRLHFVVDAGRADAQYLDDIAFNGESIPEHVLGALTL